MTTYGFEGFDLDTQRQELRRGEEVIPLEPQVFGVLAYLVAHHDRVVGKDELLDEVWHTRFVTESTLTSRIKDARRAIGDDGRSQRAIRTAHGRGYRFVAPVAVASPPSRVAPPGDAPDLDLGYCRAGDGVRVAYGTSGSGPPLVKAANWLTHLRHDTTSVVWGHWIRDLSARYRLVRYDERGCGMSDWDAEDVSFDAWVRDLETVVDALGLDRFALLGISQGSAVAAAYAAQHPERVTHLVLYGGFPLGRTRRARSAEELHDSAIMLDLLETGWGRVESPFGQMFASQFMPNGSPRQWEAFVDVQRRTTSARNARRLMTTSAGIDVTELAATIRTPTLVLHACDDHRVPLEQGELFADLIPGARFVTLESHNHILLDAEPAWTAFLEEVDRFLAT